MDGVYAVLSVAAMVGGGGLTAGDSRARVAARRRRDRA
jgi:hypothetical protein